MVSPKLTKFSPILRPSQSSSTELPSPTTVASPRSDGRRRRFSSTVEPFPPLESEGTVSTVESISHIPRTTLLSSSALRQEPRPQQHPSKAAQAEAKKPLQSQSDRTDVLWAEMQATLADVELSASRGTHFFGSKHSAALEELRNTQMALAQAWTRGEDGEGSESVMGKGIPGLENDDEADSDQSPGASIKDTNMATADAEAARKRREANDRYFSRIQRNVTDVVDKLEAVAQAMGRLEQESREIWSSGSEDLDSSSA